MHINFVGYSDKYDIYFYKYIWYSFWDQLSYLETVWSFQVLPLSWIGEEKSII